jgi:nucleoside-diphosphate-sugar epimerase
MKSIALTGATSMIGIALLKQCVLNNVRAYAFVRPGSLRIGRLPQSNLVAVIERDLDNLAGVGLSDVALSKVDVFYHIGWNHTDKQGRNSCDKQTLNIRHALDAVQMAKKLGCAKFVGIGSQAEYGRVSAPLNSAVPANPETAYGIAKYAAGKVSKLECERLEMGFNWIRIASVYGANDNDDTLIKTFIDKCKNNQPMPLSECSHVWDYLYEDDAGRALFSVGEKSANGKTYCLGSGIGRPLKEYVEAIKNIINAEYQPDYGKIPYTEKSIQYLCADISDLTADTGWRPEVSFEEGIRKVSNALSLTVDRRKRNTLFKKL